MSGELKIKGELEEFEQEETEKTETGSVNNY